jgi:hypothetical protein
MKRVVDIERVFRERTEIDRAMARAARHARLEAKLWGQPLVVWKDGKVVLIPPDEIVVDPEPTEGGRAS